MIQAIPNRKSLTIIEIGCWTGKASCLFAGEFKEVYCVDPWEATAGTISEEYNMADVEAIFDSRTIFHDNVFKIKGRSENVVEYFKDKHIDIVYIDGEHTYEACKRDIENYLPLAKKYIAGHDYWPGRFDGVIQAVHECIGSPGKIFSDTSWIKEL